MIKQIETYNYIDKMISPSFAKKRENITLYCRNAQQALQSLRQINY
jgi:hypothetical protein